jgi:hypothetical protein
MGEGKIAARREGGAPRFVEVHVQADAGLAALLGGRPVGSSAADQLIGAMAEAASSDSGGIVQLPGDAAQLVASYLACLLTQAGPAVAALTGLIVQVEAPPEPAVAYEPPLVT